jgi:hypothetical protein
MFHVKVRLTVKQEILYYALKCKTHNLICSLTYISYLEAFPPTYAQALSGI